jgi:hypothetical protein
MQKTMLALIAVAGLGLVGVSGVMAAPTAGLSLRAAFGHSSDAMQVRNGCGRGRHREGRQCVQGCGPGWHFSSRYNDCQTGRRLPKDGA